MDDGIDQILRVKGLLRMKSQRAQMVRPRRKIDGKYEFMKKNSANQPPDSE